MQTLARRLLTWWDEGHADLPWRHTRNPYHIWVSEIMLQQTQIATVIPYYERWIARFPTLEQLAQAPLDDVLKMWEGLGYYSRARNLHTAARVVVDELDGEMPQMVEGLLRLKGIGRYTAGAIASIAFDQSAPVLDGNVIRVLSRLTDLSNDTTQTTTKNALWQLAETLVPAQRAGDYNQALMELGQKICQPTNPRCHICPVTDLCLAREHGTQLERPVRPPRKRTPHYDMSAGVIYREDGRFLLVQRPLNGLLGGLWGFPHGRLEKGESKQTGLIRICRDEYGVIVQPNIALMRVKHAYTHFRITLHVFRAMYLSGDVSSASNHVWATLSELETLAFALTDRKIIEGLSAETHQPPLNF